MWMLTSVVKYAGMSKTCCCNKSVQREAVIVVAAYYLKGH